MKRLVTLLVLVIIFSGMGISFALADSVTVIVDGRSAPWVYDAVNINQTYSYGIYSWGYPNLNWDPTVVNSSYVSWTLTSGGGTNPEVSASNRYTTYGMHLPMRAGDTLTIQWDSGSVCGGDGGSVWTDGANGVINFTYNPLATPAQYLPVNQLPVNFMALMGVFADSTGTIVGSPFVIGNGPVTLTIPVNAQKLQMGFIDDWYNDNFADLQVTVTESPVPAPCSILLLGSGLAGLGLLRRNWGLKA